MSSDPLTKLSEADRVRLEGLLVEFDLNWTSDRLIAAAGRLPPAGPFREAALREMVKIDLERQARRGRPVSLRNYFERFPELADSGVASTDLRDAEAAAHETIPRAATGSIHLPEGFGRYRIFRPLGRGGMGGVYLARDTELDRLVALKVPRFPSDDATAVERFTREAKAAATIDHPNVCRVYDVGRIDGLPYISMAYVEGPTLADVLRDGPLPPKRAAEIARDVARALAEAHRRGVVHRDLKPANILLQKDEGGRMKDEGTTDSGSSFQLHPLSLRPVVTDFGLAARTAPDDPRLTAEGLVAGTPPYMSPEQVAGERVGPAGDVYSLGAVLYELLTGRTPFVGSASEILTQALTATPVPPSAVRTGIDRGLDAIALKALAKRTWDRFPGMTELADALDGWLAATGVRAPGSKRAGVWSGVGAAALVLLGLVVVLTRPWAGKSSEPPAPNSGAPTAVTGQTVALTTVVPSATTIGAGSATTPNGTTTRTRSTTRLSFNLKPHTRPKTVIEGSLKDPEERIAAISFSPDGRQVYAATVNKAGLGVRRWDAGTGREVPTKAKRDAYTWATFTADGRQYLAGGGPGIVDLRQSESGKIDKQFRTEPRAAVGAVSRDGLRVIVGLNSRTERRARVYDVTSEQPVGEFRSHEKDIRCVALSQDGKYAYSASPDRHVVWDAPSGKPATEAGHNGVVCATFLSRVPVLVFAYQTGEIATIDLRVGVRFGDFQDTHRDAITCVAVSPAGSAVVTADTDKTVRGWEPFARMQRWKVGELPEPVLSAAFAPDSRRFVTATARTWQIWE